MSIGGDCRMIGFFTNLEDQTIANTNFRKVLFTGQHAQLVVMSLKPNEEIGLEVHTVTDQFIRVETGIGMVIMHDEQHELKAGDAVIIPAGIEHNIINISSTDELKLYTIYAPSHHKDGTVHKTKGDAESDQDDHL